MDKITKIIEKPYPIYIGEINAFDFEQFQQIIKAFSQVIIIIDEHTKIHCLPRLISIPSFRTNKIIEIKSGEASKSIQKAIEIWESFTDLNLDRNSLIVNLGGGVISDLGGFVATVFKRGLHYINIPTTLLSMIDASIGGKTGVNYKGYKNQLGIFADPEVVFIDPSFLETLPKRELYAGFAEIIKYALIMDAVLWNMLLNIKPENILENTEIIKRAVYVKSNIVNTDPFEKDIRKILNFGHTIAHAIESFSLANDENPLLHGEAVAIGLICETYISVKKNGLDEQQANKIYSYIRNLFSPYIINPLNIPDILEIIKQDKKNKNKKLNFTLLTEIGKSLINNDCDESLITESIAFYTNLN
ncbi:MAG: 3-dehydroquinate synthase [Bacteroidales bacterium]